MPWELTEDVEKFAAEAGGFLRSKPVEHTVLLTLIDNLRRRGLHVYGSGVPVFGCWRTPSGVIDGVLLQTPPHPMMFSSLPADAVGAAVEALADRPLLGVNMSAGQIDEFVAGRAPASATVHRRVRLYILDKLTSPEPPAGRARTAGAGDRPLLLRWSQEFHETLGESHFGDLGADVDERIGYGGIVLWEVDGEPVSMAARSRIESGMVRVQLVYTPAALRGRGYAGAATAVVTQAALDEGAATVVLFTDLANPTSNGLYQRLGYRPVEDRVVMEFSS
jgi:RimJ/RimL family protein N-acetyltransferase